MLQRMAQEMKKKKNQTLDVAELTFFNKKQNLVLGFNQQEGNWLAGQIPQLSVMGNQQSTFGELSKSFEEQTDGDFVLFWNSTSMKKLRENGLLIL